MKWEGREESDNVEDSRSVSGAKIAGGAGIIGVIVLLINMFVGGDTAKIANGIQQQLQQQNTQTTNVALTEAQIKQGHFVRTILRDTELVWAKVFQENGLNYQNPKLRLFSGSVETACGGASSALGPFYCPGDQKVYLDYTFFEELKSRFGAEGGDFAVAYVIAHEIGHHVQYLMGTSDKVRQAQQGKSEIEANKYSVALELQADFYAGVWTHYDQKINNILEDGDIEEALSAANAVGDDAIQTKTQGQVYPDSFTHGTSAQRIYWFKKGYETGDIKQGNTFADIK